MEGAISEIDISGINTNIDLHREIMADSAFGAGGANIHYLEKKLGLYPLPPHLTFMVSAA